MEKLNINEWAEEDRPREKLMRLGADALSNAELLAILIGSGSTKETAVELMKRVLNECDNNLNTLGKMSINELCAFNGIGEAKAITILAACELGKRRAREKAAERPDLLIVSFGTNEAHGSTLDERVHAETMRTLTQRISEQCPGVCFLFTTPPGSYISQRTGSYTTGTGRRRRTHYSTTKVPNQNTANVARSIVNFCHSHHMAVWDIFTIAGGATSACTNWRNAGLMNTDCIHYVAAGYTLQGKLLGEAIYKAYTGTATSGSQTRMMHGSTPKEQKPYKTVKGF